jgi:hypothetical protein
VTTFGDNHRPRPSRPEGLRRYVFVILMLVGATAVAIPLTSVAEVNWAGGPTRYCTHTGVAGNKYGDYTTYAGLVECEGDRPDYWPPVPLYVGGVLLLSVGLVGVIVRTVQIRRGTVED